LQNRWKPPPVPEMPTVIRTFGFFFVKASAAAVVYGPTVLEPSAVIVPLKALPPAETAVAATPATTATAVAVRMNRMLICLAFVSG
jgi:hypothetical protein